MIFIIIFCLPLLFLTYRLTSYLLNLRKIYLKLAPIPGPSLLEGYRQMLTYFFKLEPIGTKACKFGTSLCTQYGGSLGIAQMGKGLFPPHLFVCSDKLAKKILAHPAFQNKSDVHRFLGNVITGNDIFTCSGTQAKTYRHELRRHFFPKTLVAYIDQFESNLAVLDAKLSRIVDSKEENGVIEDIKPTLSALVLDSIGDNLFGLQFNAQKEVEQCGNGSGEPSFIASLEYIFAEVDCLMVEQWKTTPDWRLLNCLCYLVHANFWRLPRLVWSVLHFKLSMVWLVLKLYWRAYKERSNLKKDDHFKPSSMMEAVVGRRISDLLSYSFSPLTAYSNFQEALWHLTMFTIAGHQTSTSSLCWTLYYLCKHPSARRKLQSEVDDFLSRSPAMTEVLTDKSALRYLDAVLKEALRLAPAAPYLGRKASEDVTLSVNAENSDNLENSKDQLSITIPAGVNVSIMAQYMHYSERYFGPNAASFSPERFLNTAGQKAPAGYFPFSAGSRHCFGEQYAVLQMKLTLITLCRKYDFTLAYPGTICEPQHSLAQRPARFAIKFSRRTENTDKHF